MNPAQHRADRAISEAIEDAVQPLVQVNRGLGWLRLVALLVPSLGCLWMSWHRPELARAPVGDCPGCWPPRG